MSESKRQRGDGRVFVRAGSKFLWIQYNDHGRCIRMSSGETDRNKAEKLLKKKTGGVLNNIHSESRSLRYEDLRKAFYDERVLNKQKSLRHDKDGNAYLEPVKRLDAFFEGYKVIHIDADTIRKFQRGEVERELSNGSVNRSVACLRRMFTLALQDEKIKSAPYFKMLKEAKPRQGLLPQAKYPELLATLPDYLRLPTIIGFHTGMRLGEILSLKWGTNVLWGERIIRILETKNGDIRDIPFSGELDGAMRRQFVSRQPGCEFVCFRVNRLGRAEPIGDFRKVWRRVCVKLGLGSWEVVANKKGETILEKPRYLRSKAKPKLRYNGLLFHDLRRTFITDAETAGAPRHEVMKLSGHKTESVYKRYAIDAIDPRRAALEKIQLYRSGKKHSSGTVEALSAPSNDLTH